MSGKVLSIEGADFRAYPVFQDSGSAQVGNATSGILGSIFTTIVSAGSAMQLYDGLNDKGKIMWDQDDGEVSASTINVRFSNGLFIVVSGAPSAAFTLIVAFG